MTAPLIHRCTYAVVPSLPGYGGYDVFDGTDLAKHGGIPPLGVLNMPEPAPLPVGGSVLVDLVVGWNPDEVDHIKAVTGIRLTASRTRVVAFTGVAPDYEDLFLPVGVVAAKFHVTGCHRAVLSRDGGSCCPFSQWALHPDATGGADVGLWHWTGHAKKVQP